MTDDIQRVISQGMSLIQNYEKALILILLAIFAIIIFNNAWLGDDAFISFRTIDNFENGYGLTWNISERVQSFTHPLWILVLIIVSSITGELIYTTMILSVSISLLAIILFTYKSVIDFRLKILAIMAICLSNSFVQFSSSGLENPLTYLLIVIFMIVYANHNITIRRLLYLSLIAALASLTRIDMIIIYAPFLISYIIRLKKSKWIICLSLGFLPLFLWELFSLFYYGFLFPNTAYAKLNSGLDKSEIFGQGFRYLQDVVLNDPLTAILIVVGIFMPVISKKHNGIPYSIAILMYILYTIYIGGCFMSGRYYAAPFLLAIISISRLLNRPAIKQFAGYAVVILIIGLGATRSPVFTTERDTSRKFEGYYQIADERSCYFPSNGLRNYLSKDFRRRACTWEKEGINARNEKTKYIAASSVGMLGYYAGPHVYIMDANALTDALLARLPVYEGLHYRPGHYTRVRPPGYEKTLQSDSIQIEDPNLAIYYEKLHTIISGPLWDMERCHEIVLFNLGHYDHLLELYEPPQNVGKIRP